MNSSRTFFVFLKASKADIKFLLAILPASSPVRSLHSYLLTLFKFHLQAERKIMLQIFLKSHLEQIRVITMFSKKVLEKCNKEELIAKLLETYKKHKKKTIS